MINSRKVREDLDRARREYGGRDWPESFADRLTEPLPGFRDVVRMVRELRRTRPRGSVTIPRVPPAPLSPLATGQAALTWIGHATYVIRIGGRTVLTDPVWSRRIPGGLTRLAPPGLPLDAIGHVDAVVISHNHFDHLDAPTIRRLPRDTTILVPGMLGSFFRQRGFRHVVELDWWESVPVGDVEVAFVPAHHWSRRGLSDTCRTLWGGWMLTGDGHRIHFAGDSGYGHRFGEIGRRYPGIGMAVLPIGAYEPNWFMRPAHLGPEEAVRACADLGAARMATMHWGTFPLSAEPPLEPPVRAAAAWLAAGRDRADLWDLAIGETRIL